MNIRADADSWRYSEKKHENERSYLTMHSQYSKFMERHQWSGEMGPPYEYKIVTYTI